MITDEPLSSGWGGSEDDAFHGGSGLGEDSWVVVKDVRGVGCDHQRVELEHEGRNVGVTAQFTEGHRLVRRRR